MNRKLLINRYFPKSKGLPNYLHWSKRRNCLPKNWKTWRLQNFRINLENLKTLFVLLLVQCIHKHFQHLQIDHILGRFLDNCRIE